MALDRQTIEKKDFPIARRGYEPDAVDAHLASLGEEVERLQRELAGASRGGAPGAAPAAQRSGPASLAIAASEQVRTIVEAAESSAADIERSAQEDAARIRTDAQSDAARTRDDAVTRSEAHVGKVGDAASNMLDRVGLMETELGKLVDNLRSGTNQLTAELSMLQSDMGELYEASGRRSEVSRPSRAMEAGEASARPQPAQFDDEPGAGSDEAEQDLAVPASEEPAVIPAPAEPVEEPVAEEAYVDEPALAETVDGSEVDPAAAGADGAPEAPDAEPFDAGPERDATARRSEGGDVEGARLIALNMALNGQSRDETDRYLRDNFELPDRAALLDEVYATVEG
ncbi:MAG: hypothetical protein QOH43_46 [Solirubrobacteraceae bacterium]|nr:hypothetical protein [Solirubrobacteraceae bacterium]